MSSPETTTTFDRSAHKKHAPSRSAVMMALVAVGILIVCLVIYVTWRHAKVQKELDQAAKSQAQKIVDTDTVKRASKSHSLTLPGNVQAFQSATLYARTNGYIKAWYKDIGAPVKTGDLIAEIEAPDVDAQLRQSEATLVQARANLDIAKLNYERQQDLLQKKVISQQDFDTSRTTMDAQEGAVKAADANVQNLQVQQGFQKIVAPFDGIVTNRYIDVGVLVSLGSTGTGTQLFAVAQTDPLRIFVYVPQTNAPDIHDGMNAKLLVSEYPGRTFDGTVTRTAGAIDPASRTLLTEVDIPNKDGALYAGMYGQIKFTLEEEKPPILLPANELMFRTAGPMVAVVDKDNKIHLQTVKIGRDFGTSVELISGLDEGVTLVVNPTDDLQDGTVVTVKPPEQKPADNAGGQGAQGGQQEKSGQGGQPEKKDDSNNPQPLK
jgi:RND family efflux transporter MFP subunit